MRLLPIVIGLTVVSASSLFAVHLQQTGLAHGGQYLPAAVCSSSLWAVYKQASLEASSPTVSLRAKWSDSLLYL